MKKAILTLLVLLLILAAGCTVATLEKTADTAKPDPELPITPHVLAGTIVVRGFEWGPGVNKVILELDKEADGVILDDACVITSHWKRTITAAYPSDSLGYKTDDPSRYIAFELETSFECTGSPFETDMTTEHNEWAEEYIVTVSVTVVKNNTRFDLHFSADCIENRICPELSRFTESQVFTGDYKNPLTQETETLSLTWTAYEPDSLDSWEQNPLIVWLHGLGEGGTDIEKTILGNEASALTESTIQSYFVSGEQTGAYVLIPQTPTYWMDAGDGAYHMGDKPSRYTEMLMDLILAYLAQNPDVDPDRIYLGGASNGGYMALEMLINYPDFFAAAFPCCPAYAYHSLAQNPDGSYRTLLPKEYIYTNRLYMTPDKIHALLETPIWFLHALDDTIVSAFEYTMPIYRDLLKAGADNHWCSLYFNSTGSESEGSRYLGHWVWTYLLNDEVSLVQNPEPIRESGFDTFLLGYYPEWDGGSVAVTDEGGAAYDSLFAWLADQRRD